jgi:hypothetical protein
MENFCPCFSIELKTIKGHEYLLRIVKKRKFFSTINTTRILLNPKVNKIPKPSNVILFMCIVLVKIKCLESHIFE